MECWTEGMNSYKRIYIRRRSRWWANRLRWTKRCIGWERSCTRCIVSWVGPPTLERRCAHRYYCGTSKYITHRHSWPSSNLPRNAFRTTAWFRTTFSKMSTAWKECCGRRRQRECTWTFWNWRIKSDWGISKISSYAINTTICALNCRIQWARSSAMFCRNTLIRKSVECAILLSSLTRGNIFHRNRQLLHLIKRYIDFMLFTC